MSFLTGNALGSCACGCASDITSVIALVPFNFYQKQLAGSASGAPGTGIPTTTKIGQPDLSNNSGKFLRRIVSIELWGGAYTGVLDTQFNRDTGEETTNRDDSIPGFIQMSWFLTYAGIAYGGWHVTNVVSSDRLVQMTLYGYDFGVPSFVGTATIQYLDEVEYQQAAADADALLATVTLLGSGYTAIDGSTLRTTGAATPAATTALYTGKSLVVSKHTACTVPGTTIFVNWPNSDPAQIIGNTLPAADTWPIGTSGKQQPVAAHGAPGFIQQPFLFGDERFFRWPPAVNGEAYFFKPGSDDYYGSQNPLHKIDFVVSMKSALSFSSGIQTYSEAVYDPTNNLWTTGTIYKPAMTAGQHVFEPTDLGAAFGYLSADWGQPTNSPVGAGGGQTSEL
jgi:hypothetical protein